MQVNGTSAGELQLVEFANDDEQLHIEAEAESLLLLGHALPFQEPVVARGPFVMNSEQEIMEAYRDYQQGKFGSWS
ncbi:pirin-like C-terminal cupin domain-containing protein [Cesiribacter andamanensis]|uniref:pirin-like C-terminal cupin domain-containing protein n=1 Tax=Cesiribacter andamanensis TaxID=649507 RepID=UPI0029344767|nr:pirin-like C-terminal cupin domain-containing protein [Cesiribacter andamanensis]